ncbi:MAG: hypothetical protein KY475_11085 [Planctomycetes bacterium]|nr:hypothetical protein [Planctomycetota bacterium]
MISPGLAALAAPLAGAVASAAADAVRGVDSAFGKLLRGDHKATPSPNAAGANAGTLDAAALQDRFDQLLKQFRSQASARLSEAGVDVESGVVLESDVLGELRVVGPGAQAAQMEGILGDDASLVAAFDELREVHRELSRQRRAEELDHLYDLDPNAAWRADEGSTLDEPAFRVTLTKDPLMRG